MTTTKVKWMAHGKSYAHRIYGGPFCLNFKSNITTITTPLFLNYPTSLTSCPFPTPLQQQTYICFETRSTINFIKMTKWGRKNTSSSSTSNNVFLKSWLSRFKNTKGGAGPEDQPQSSDTGRRKANKISKEDDDGDGFYWALSFDNERDEGFKILSSSDHKLNVSPIGYGGLIFDGTKMKEFSNGEADSNEGFQKSPADYLLQDSNLEKEWQKLENMEINEDQNQRKSVHIRSKHGGKVKAYYNPPRTDGRMIKDVEDMKKPWMKIKKDRRVVEDAFRTGLDSFAIVKTSYDPQKDFRESMMEMIKEKELRKPEELEELLACYLTLNCDGFHDLIVNVFRQVWFELNQLHFDQHVEF